MTACRLAVAAVCAALVAGCSATHAAQLANAAWPPVGAVADAFAAAGVRRSSDGPEADGGHDASTGGGDRSDLPYPWGTRLPEMLADRADRLPGRAPPAAPGPAGERTVLWNEGDARYQTRIAIEGADAPTRRAHVVTLDEQGRPLVAYDGAAFLDDHGSLHVDARGAAITGPWSGSWSPDSFAIDPSGDVFTLDDAGQAERGSTGGQSNG